MTNLIIDAHATHGGGKGKIVSSAFGTTVVKVKNVKKFMQRTNSGVKASGSQLRRITGTRQQRRQDQARNRQIAEQFAGSNYKNGGLSAKGQQRVATQQKRRAKQGK